MKKHLLVGLLGISLPLTELVTPAFALPYDTIRARAGITLNEEIHSTINFVARIISIAPRADRRTIQACLCYLEQSEKCAILRDLLCKIALQDFMKEYVALSFKSKSPIKLKFRKSRVSLILEHIINQKQYSEIHYKLLWVLRQAFTDKYSFDSVTCVCENFFRTQNSVLPKTCQIPEDNSTFFGLKEKDPIEAPIETVFDSFIKAWKAVNKNGNNYGSWAYSNGDRIGKAIEGGNYPKISAHLTGYILSLDSKTIDGLIETLKKREWFFNRKSVRKKKQVIGESVDTLYKIQQLSEKEKHGRRIWHPAEVPNDKSWAGDDQAPESVE